MVLHMVKKKELDDLLGASDLDEMDRLVFGENKIGKNSGKNSGSVSGK